VVRLSDVARVELGSEEATGQAGFNGEPADLVRHLAAAHRQ